MITPRVLLLVIALAGSVATLDRGARWFNRGERTITKTVKATQWVTKATPSSCVVVQTSLPPCRNIRAVNIQPTQPLRIMQTEAPGMPVKQDEPWKPIIHPSDSGPTVPRATAMPRTTTTTPKPSTWGWNFFNFGPKEVYVTETVIEVKTSQYMDPNTVVTFSVKGCRPSRLPFDLPECAPLRAEPPPPVPAKSPESGIVVMAPVHFYQPMPLKTSEPPPKEEMKVTDEKESNKEEKQPEEKDEKQKD